MKIHLTRSQEGIRLASGVTSHPLYCALQLYSCIIHQEEASEELHSAHILDIEVNFHFENINRMPVSFFLF